MPDAETDRDLSLSRTFIMQDGVLLPEAIDEKAGAAQALPEGMIIDEKYKIISLLGEGGMGSVYRVHHLHLDKDMAFKTFRTRQIDPESSQRFELEARAIARLSHKNIVQVYDFGATSDGRPYYTMELLHGDSLVKCITERSLSLRETLEIFMAVAEGLAHAHKAGIIHRDVKPENIHLGAPSAKAGKISSVKIVDFGIAKLAMETTLDQSGQSNQTNQSLTKIGRVFGSPLYMSPEQSIGQPTDHTTDIYSFGCALFEAITGRPPFIGKDSRATLSSHRLDPPPTLSQCAPGKVFPQRLEGLVARLLKKEQKDRPQSCDEVRREIRRILNALADVQAAGEKTIANNAENALRSDLAKQGRTDPLIAADKALSKVFGSNLKVKLPLVILSLSALIVGIFWLTEKNDWLAARKNNLPGSAPAIFEKSIWDTRTQPKIFTKPKEKYFARETATSKVFLFPSGDPIGQIKGCEHWIPACGEVKLPKECQYTFKAEQAIANSPQLLSGFGPDDLCELEFNSVEDWKDEHLKWACRLTGLQGLDLDFCDLTPASIEQLSKLTKLHKIVISSAKVKGSDWARLGQLSTLEDLKTVDVQDLAPLLSKLKEKNKLTNLQIMSGRVTDANMAAVAALKKLTRLRVAGNELSINGLKEIRLLPELVFLNISKSRFRVGAVDVISTLSGLEELELETTRGIITDADMPKIARLKRLRSLRLTGTTVTANGLKALLTLPKLRHLSIARSLVGPDSIPVLASMPALKELEIQTGKWGYGNQKSLYQIMKAKKVDLKQTEERTMDSD